MEQKIGVQSYDFTSKITSFSVSSEKEELTGKFKLQFASQFDAFDENGELVKRDYIWVSSWKLTQLILSSDAAIASLLSIFTPAQIRSEEYRKFLAYLVVGEEFKVFRTPIAEGEVLESGEVATRCGFATSFTSCSNLQLMKLNNPLFKGLFDKLFADACAVSAKSGTEIDYTKV